MDNVTFVFGTSQFLLEPKWRVWTYDVETSAIVPLADYRDQAKCNVAAFELAEAVSRLRDPKVQDRILANRDADPTPLSGKEAKLIGALAVEALAENAPLEAGKASVDVTRREEGGIVYDNVYVVRIPVVPAE